MMVVPGARRVCQSNKHYKIVKKGPLVEQGCKKRCNKAEEAVPESVFALRCNRRN
jgi:hypothetical protein